MITECPNCGGNLEPPFERCEYCGRYAKEPENVDERKYDKANFISILGSFVDSAALTKDEARKAMNPWYKKVIKSVTRPL